MDQQPKIPTLKDAQKPQVKIKGLGAGLTLFDRLKQFKKKDLAFILAGLGTLFMAPLAEHFMMAPENGDSTLAQGWGGTGGRGSFFGNGGSPYENGNNNIAQGGAIGGAGDIITPLNVRDPSALVMGPGAAQQPPAGSAAPATPPPAAPARNENDYKDALAGAASRAASAAVKKAPLPVPKVALGGSGLRGLGVAGGGSSASGGLGPINSGNLGQAGTGGGGLNLVRSTPGFRSAAGPRGPNSPQGLDGTKKAGQNAGDAFSRTGSALSGLNAAAAEQIPTGGSGFAGNGQGGAGANDKGPGGSGPGGSKSVGESLAFIAAKERMMENLKLEFEKRKLKDPELLLYGIRNDVLKASAGEIGKGLTKMFMCSALGMGCPAPDDDYMCNGMAQTSAMIQANLCTGTGKDGDRAKDHSCFDAGGNNSYVYVDANKNRFPCTASGKKGGAPPSKTETAVTGTGGLSSGDLAAMKGLGDVCTKSAYEIKNNSDAGVKIWAEYLGKKANHLASARKALMGDAAPLPCVAAPVAGEKSLKELQADALKAMSGAGAAEDANTMTGKIKAGAKADKLTPVPTADVEEKVKKSKDVLTAIQAYVKDQAPSVVPIPALYDPTKPSENRTAVALEGQITTANNTIDKLVDNLAVVQKGLDDQLGEIKKMVGDGGAGDAGALKEVQLRNTELKAVADKTAPAAGYEKLDKAPAVTVADVVRNSDEQKTLQAAKDATAPIQAADAKVEDYKTKKAAAEPAEPKDTKVKRDADAESAKTAANEAVKAAVAKDADARTNIIGWAGNTKTILNDLSSMIISTPPAK